jgi:hypothetical protein
MLNCSRCAIPIPSNHEYIRQDLQECGSLLKTFKTTILGRKKECKKLHFCRSCAKKIDRINSDIEMFAPVVFIICIVLVAVLAYSVYQFLT